MDLSNELTKETIEQFGFDDNTVQKLREMSKISTDTSWRSTSEHPSSASPSKSRSGTKFIVPTLNLLQLAAQFANNDWLATHSNHVEFDLSRNITAIQLINLVNQLERHYKSIPGMENAGSNLRICCQPLIVLATGLSGTDPDMLLEWGFTQAEVDQILASDREALEALEKGMSQLRQRFEETDAINNYEAIFYQHATILEFTPSTRLFDFYTSHVAARNTSIWQWTQSATNKRRRIASLKVESLNLLGAAMERGSQGQIYIVRDDSPYEDMRMALES